VGPRPPLKLPSQPPVGEAGKAGPSSRLFRSLFIHLKGLWERVRAHRPLPPTHGILSDHLQGTDELGEEVVYRGGDTVFFAPGRDLGV
jgi:hypothetical protein